MIVLAKRSSMTLLSDPVGYESHSVRVVLAEKGVTVDVVDLNGSRPPPELADYNPYSTLPTLVDRDLVLYEPKIMMEYLDERFPHPPLLSVYPVSRAESRLYMHRIQTDWWSQIDAIKTSRSSNVVERATKELRESLVGVSPVFREKPYFMNEEFTLVDCCMAPLLWRLPSLGIELRSSRQTKPLLDYMDRLFNRESFQASLSEQEREMRP